jgi:hypothetical protein
MCAAGLVGASAKHAETRSSRGDFETLSGARRKKSHFRA